ncbi:tetratricopeptide repeat protein [Saccharopolyspora indica]|uniref:ATP-binding protein n=1 Tax=Saccharopolyspora indica TaxID=1229659 RepID=UPI0022EA4DEA|nr:tetratricopeptide repeat protein [Saccharopolyspora indica]MDA3644037.1 tetratricopeptide repeat protein [Saccharopolyspora indica]
MAERQPDGPGNRVSELVAGSMVQAHTISGGIHHHRTAPARPIPRQLPLVPGDFTGRDAEFDALTALLESTADRGDAVMMSVIGGQGGIGKTTLALRWAHQHLDRFPDGQLFVDFRGFDPKEEPLTASSALHTLLAALGIEPPMIPSGTEAKSSLYRSLIAEKRMLIVLDNARTADQVVPLLPGTPACAVLITSRDRLPRLTTRYGARPLHLAALTDSAARELLTARLGAARLAAEPAAVDEILARCRGFPLALSVISGRGLTQPNFPLHSLAEQLRDSATRLGVLDAGDPQSSLRAVLSWSYDALPPDAARAFGLLGIAPGPDISARAATSLLGVPDREAERALRTLERMSLLDEHTSGRYRMHDLTRLYATEKAREQAAEQRDTALLRVTSHYVHTARAGDRLLSPHRPQIDLVPPPPSCQPVPPTDEQAALAWFDAEHACLLAVQVAAAGLRWHDSVWNLAWVLDTFHLRRGHLHDRVAMWRAGLISSDHLDDIDARTRAHRLLGHSYARIGQHDEASDHLHRALGLAEDAANHHAQGLALRLLAQAWTHRGQHQPALEHALRALQLFRTAQDPVEEAHALNAAAWYQALLGDYDEARTHCRTALALFRHHGLRGGQANALDSLGYIAHHTGDPHLAQDFYQQALQLFRELTDTYNEAEILEHLGHPREELGQHDQARAAWQQALELYRTQHRIKDADRVQRLLDALDHRTAQD